MWKPKQMANRSLLPKLNCCHATTYFILKRTEIKHTPNMDLMDEVCIKLISQQFSNILLTLCLNYIMWEQILPIIQLWPQIRIEMNPILPQNSATPTNSLVCSEACFRRLGLGLRWWSRLLWLGRVNKNNPAIQELSIHFFASLLSFFYCFICNKTKSLWSSTWSIYNDFCCKFIKS